MKINANNSNIAITVGNARQFPRDPRPEIALSGRSNVGKSSLINTLLGMKLDIRTRKPILANVTGGLSGPAVFPVALRMVWQVSQVTKLPLLGMGGVATAEDAAAMMIAGATVVALGTACFANPYAPIEVRDGLEAYCRENGIDAVRDIIGTIVTEK